MLTRSIEQKPGYLTLASSAFSARSAPSAVKNQEDESTKAGSLPGSNHSRGPAVARRAGYFLGCTLWERGSEDEDQSNGLASSPAGAAGVLNGSKGSPAGAAGSAGVSNGSPAFIPAPNGSSLAGSSAGVAGVAGDASPG